ncbi:MAG TPA: hypothetical protein VHX44_10765 [Planctomycetota bacterium]|nr:hypothetical protein [Planctomycetota bacterium]
MTTAVHARTPRDPAANAAAESQRIPQGITGDVIGRLTSDATIGKRSTVLTLAVNLPHQARDGQAWEEHPMLVSVLVVGAAHQALVAGIGMSLQQNAIVLLNQVALEIREFSRGAHTELALAVHLSKPEQITIEQHARPDVPTVVQVRPHRAAGRRRRPSDRSSHAPIIAGDDRASAINPFP